MEALHWSAQQNLSDQSIRGRNKWTLYYLYIYLFVITTSYSVTTLTAMEIVHFPQTPKTVNRSDSKGPTCSMRLGVPVTLWVLRTTGSLLKHSGFSSRLAP